MRQQYGLDSCCLASFRAAEMQSLLSLESTLIPELVIALGYGAQHNRAEPYSNTPAYRLDGQDNFIVPKYTTDDVLVYTDI